MEMSQTQPNSGVTIPAFLIDPSERTIEPVTLTRKPTALAEIYELLGCQTITIVHLDNHDAIYVDDESLLGGTVYQFFGVKGVGQPLAGRGLVIGVDQDGHDTAPKQTLDQLRARLVFIERLYRDLWSVAPASNPRMGELMPLDDLTAQMEGRA